MEKIKITLFAGGSGNSRLINIISKLENIEVKVIVNCYDDGKSTGRLRNILPGMLGPSDLRKNISSLLNENDNYEKKLKYLIDYRFKKINIKKIIKNINNNIELNKVINSLPRKNYQSIVYYLRILEKTFNKNNHQKDLSMGNAIFSGIYLKNKNFNKSVEIFSEIFGKKNSVYNVSDGENLFLCAIRKNGQILYSEEDIVNKPGILIDDIYLIKKKINNDEKKKISNLSYYEKKIHLNKINKIPLINNLLKNIILKSNIIIYGPGTVHSSLFPTYLTKNLSKFIKNSKAIKVLITNIGKDKDMMFEDTDNIIRKTNFYLNLKKKTEYKNLIDYYFINKVDKDDLNNKYLKNYLELKSLPKKNLKYLDWEEEKGKHNSVTLLKEIIKTLKTKSPVVLDHYSNISIIVPCYNEKRTIKNVCEKLKAINFYSKGNLLYKEIIVVDSSSKDNSDKILKSIDNIKYYQINNLGRGKAIRYGVEKSKGDIIVIFPSDDEYNVDEIQKIIDPILSKHTDITFGSRAIKCTNLSNQISKIYKNNYFGYLISKYGGMVLSIMCLLFFNRYVSDPLTTFKAFRKKTYNDLNFLSNGVNLEIEMIAKISKTENYILEIPVNYSARNKDNGKKITIFDGISCLMSIFKFKIFN